ncbi:HNH endonuclease signature motif containing protein [Pseudonocardia nigra]|uniref:HNH endonuclease signature motif containing protein n=1 Tax=Pseudonocardia nigra TaxID=1921578 RepID=UPI001C5E52C8|nr:HNH endonuclease signature motif containing protein [Pseudonocardia nigra]
MFEQPIDVPSVDDDWLASLDALDQPADELFGDPGEIVFVQLLESLPAAALDLPEPTEDGGPEWQPGMDAGPVAEYTVARIRPSGLLALDLDSSTADPAVMSDAGLIDAVIGFDRVAAWAQARQARLLAEFARRRPGDAPDLATADTASGLSRYAPDEVGLALHLSRGTAKARLGESVRLDAELAAARQAWEDGLIDQPKVRALGDATLYLTPEHARVVQDRVLDRAPTQTLAQFRAALARAVIAVDPDGANNRHREARKDRRVVIGDEKDGMAALWALLSAPDAQSAYQWLTRLARGMGTDDARGMDARRADLLVALLTGQITYSRTSPESDSAESDSADAGDAGITEPAATETCTSTSTSTWSGPPPRPVTPGKPLIQIVMPHSTLLGTDDQPCELVGYGPIPADLAREIAADSVWHRLVTDPLSGALLDYGRKTYKPPAALADFVRARDVTCRSPICRRRALDAELDHIVPFPHGPTAEPNLMDGCVHHHKNKYATGWQLTAHPDGRIEWITPTGHSYCSEPHDYRAEPEPARQAARPTRAPASRPHVDPWSAAGTADGSDSDPPPF